MLKTFIKQNRHWHKKRIEANIDKQGYKVALAPRQQILKVSATNSKNDTQLFPPSLVFSTNV